MPEQLGGNAPVRPKGMKGFWIEPGYEEAMKGPHPKPGRNDLNRIREFQEKATQFEKDLLEAGRTGKDAEREAVELARSRTPSYPSV